MLTAEQAVPLYSSGNLLNMLTAEQAVPLCTAACLTAGLCKCESCKQRIWFESSASWQQQTTLKNK